MAVVSLVGWAWFRLRAVDDVDQRETLQGGATGPPWAVTWDDGVCRATCIAGRAACDVQVDVVGSDPPAVTHVDRVGPGERVALAGSPGDEVTIVWRWDDEQETQTWTGKLPRWR